MVRFIIGANLGEKTLAAPNYNDGPGSDILCASSLEFHSCTSQFLSLFKFHCGGVVLGPGAFGLQLGGWLWQLKYHFVSNLI